MEDSHDLMLRAGSVDVSIRWKRGDCLMCERNPVVGLAVMFVEGDMLFSSLLLPPVPSL